MWYNINDDSISTPSRKGMSRSARGAQPILFLRKGGGKMGKLFKEIIQSCTSVFIFFLAWPTVYARLNATDATTLGEIAQMSETARDHLFGGVALSDALIAIVGVCVVGALVNWVIESIFTAIGDWVKSFAGGDD